jgi:hypothetical protein
LLRDLYHQRWRIQEAFKRIKHRLDLEAVSGLSRLTHEQDLTAKILSDNLNAMLCLQALAERDGQISKHMPTALSSSSGSLLKINHTRAFAHVRQCLPRWLCERASPPAEDLSRLLRHIATNVIRFLPDLHRPPRPPQPKPHEAFATKEPLSCAH